MFVRIGNLVQSFPIANYSYHSIICFRRRRFTSCVCTTSVDRVGFGLRGVLVVFNYINILLSFHSWYSVTTLFPQLHAVSPFIYNTVFAREATSNYIGATIIILSDVISSNVPTYYIISYYYAYFLIRGPWTIYLNLFNIYSIYMKSTYF